MFKSAMRTAPRRILPSRFAIKPSSPRRFLSTAPPTQKSRSWKSSALRWGLAGGVVYYYNTSTAFAEEPEGAIQQLGDSIQNVAESKLPTVEAIVEEKRLRQAQLAEEQKREQEKASIAQGQAEEAEAGEGVKEGEGAKEAEGESEGLDQLEDEADAQGAFNPVTGEINWDCPCLGGMAHGPCGEEFRAAFSCFVYSKEEPKGVECIEKFKGMQDCFREHPEVYGSELDEDEVEEELHARDEAKASENADAPDTPQTTQKITPETTEKDVATNEEPHRDTQSTKSPAPAPSVEEVEELVPRAAHDASAK